jgi:2-phospho-L-lactate guanylyltransferase
MEALLERCLGAVEAAAAHHRTAIHRVVVTGDARAEAIALRYGASLAPDVGLGPNVAIASALAVHANASECLCVLAADLPLVDEHGVWALIRTARRGHFAIGPDRLGTGTNALALPYADPTFPFSFGPHSRARHIEAAIDRGWHVEVLRCPALSVDLDESWDLDLAGRRA